jgi:type I restriction enzyme R subunit
VRDKAKLVEELRKGVDDVTGFCAQHGVSLEAIEQTAVGGLERLSLISQAVNALISPDPVRKDFLAREGAMRMLYEAVKPDPVVHEFSARVACLGVIADEIRRKTRGGPVDVSGVMGQIEKLLDESVAGVDIRDGKDKGVDLSKIDFEALAKRFKKSKTRNIDLEILKAAIRAQLEKLLRFNRTRTDFQEKFEELIEAYNAGSRTIEQLLEELIALSRALTEEQTRHVRENLSPDELVIFDILTRPAPELSSEERDGVKKVARQLLNRLKGLLVLEWRRRAQSRAKVRLAIEEALDEGLPKLFDRRLYTEKCSRVFEHVFETYAERASAE